MNPHTLIMVQNQCIERQQVELAEAWRIISGLESTLTNLGFSRKDKPAAKEWLERNEKYKPCAPP